MRVDFYQLSRNPADQVVPLLAKASLRAGQRVLVVSADEDQLQATSRALWEAGEGSFLANGLGSEPHADRQPILLSSTAEPANGARFIVLADGAWRAEALAFERTFLLFGDGELQDARECWRALGREEGLERHFWKQEGGKWREVA